MQPTFSEIKAAAKSSLKHRWPEAIAVSLVLMATSLLSTVIQQVLMSVFRINVTWSLFTTEGIPAYSVAAGIGIIAFSVIFSLAVIVPLAFGVMRWFWLVTGGSDPTVGEIFHYFSSAKVFFKTLGLSVSLYWRIIVGTIVCFAPYIAVRVLTSPELYNRLGVTMPLVMDSLNSLASIFRVLGLIAVLLWMSIYLFCYAVVFTEPQLSVRGSIKRSIAVSKGFRFSSVCFLFSFFGWWLAGILVLPLLFTVPYVFASFAVYGREVYRSNNRTAKAEV